MGVTRRRLVTQAYARGTLEWATPHLDADMSRSADSIGRMRAVGLVLLAAVGCATDDKQPSVGINTGGGNTDTSDDGSDCPSGECNGRPDPNGPARTVHILWTVGSAPASAVTCADSPQYAAELQTDPTRYLASDMILYPVPCDEGELTIADVPARYWIGGMQTSLTGSRAGAAAPFDLTTQTATIEMMPW